MYDFYNEKPMSKIHLFYIKNKIKRNFLIISFYSSFLPFFALYRFITVVFIYIYRYVLYDVSGNILIVISKIFDESRGYIEVYFIYITYRHFKNTLRPKENNLNTRTQMYT